MELKKTHKIISFSALVLLLCPYSALTVISFAAIVLFFVLNSSKTDLFNGTTKVTTKQLAVSFLVNIALLSVFILRWADYINPVIVSLAGLALCVLATPVLPVIVTAFPGRSQPLKLTDKKLGISDHIIFLLFSVVILFFVSSASPVVATDWDADSNCIFTAARGMLHGKLIYRDLIELKGIMMYVIFAAGALISPYSYTGLWIIEIIFCYLFMVITTKIQLLFVEQKSSINSVISAISVGVLYGSSSYFFGNTAEEFGIVFLALIIYFCIRLIADDDIRFSRVFIVGLLTGVVFWIKYSMCGAVFGMALFFVIYLIRRKQVKQLLKAVLGVISGFVTVSVPVILIYLFNGALYELFDVYFGMNIFKYHVTSSRGTFLDALTNPFLALPAYLGDNSQLLILVFVAFIYLFCRNKKIFAFFFAAFTFSFYVALLGNGSVVYYPFILTAFAVFGALPANLMITKFLKDKTKPVKALSLTVSFVLAGLYSLPFISNISYYGIKKDNYPTYVFSKIIMDSEDQSFICLGLIDYGFYTSMKTDPKTPCFAVLVHDQDMVNQQIQYIAENDYNYIITSNNCNYDIFADEGNVLEGYELVAVQEDPVLKGDEFYLFRKTDG